MSNIKNQMRIKIFMKTKILYLALNSVVNTKFI